MHRTCVPSLLLASSLLIVGCSADATGGGDARPQLGGGSPATSDASEDATPRFDNCALTKRKVRFLLRDWDRVVGSIGRGDHHEYTTAFRQGMQPIMRAADGCPGDASFEDFVDSVRKIDRLAKRPRAKYTLYRKAAQLGNDWLADLNWGTEAFSEG